MFEDGARTRGGGWRFGIAGELLDVVRQGEADYRAGCAWQEVASGIGGRG
jgi:hypothetical protein